VEDQIGNPLSPYAVTKYVNVLYAEVFSRCYGFNSIGLRYFNVFGPRQDPNGAYAAVIPKWAAAMISNEIVCINGDGKTSRDFCYVKNVVQANLLASTNNDVVKSNVFNVSVVDRTDLNDLYRSLKATLNEGGVSYDREPSYQDFRAGDVRHSQADISKARDLLGYNPTYNLSDGVAETMPWYIKALI